MEMSERAVLRDCLESLKHAATCYLKTSFEADSDGLRKLCDRIAIDKSEAKNAVFNLMHQAGMYETQPADAAQVTQFATAARERLQALGGPQYAPAREHGDVQKTHNTRL